MKRNNPSFRRNVRGLTLIELIIAIIIGLGFLAAVAGTISSATSKSDISADAQGVTGLIANTKTLRAGGSYGASGTNLVPSLIAMKGVPTTLTVSGTSVLNNWGGSITVVSNGAGFTTTTAGVPQEACIEEALKLSKAMYTTAINGGAAVAGQVSQAQAVAGCTNETSNTIVWATQS